jgi:hypothetical protein
VELFQLNIFSANFFAPKLAEWLIATEIGCCLRPFGSSSCGFGGDYPRSVSALKNSSSHQLIRFFMQYYRFILAQAENLVS